MPVIFRLLIVVAGLALSLLSAGAQTAKMTFVLVNDIYQMSEQAMPDGRTRGGFARLAAVVKAERAKGGPVIVAHAGDTLSPSLMSGLDRGAHIIALTNMIAPDIFVPGNHEFDFGRDVFLERMAEVKFPLYAANLRMPDGKPLASFRDRAVLDIGGVRIGITGATYDDTPRVSNPGDLKFSPAVETIKAQAEMLRREGADFVVAVIHADRRQGYDLHATRAVDLILSGHNHDLFVNFDGRNAMAESGHDAHDVTVIDATITVSESNGAREMKWWPQFRIVDTAAVTPDPDVTGEIAKYEQELSREMDIPLATTAVELDGRDATIRTREAALGNLVADAMKASAQADAAITNGGGIRGANVYSPGATMTRRDILSALPFSNRIVTIEIAGKEIRRAIENGLAALPESRGRFPQVSGLVIEADRTKPAGSRVLSIKIGNAALDDNKIYTIATNDFLARGGDGYDMFRDAKQLLPASDSPLMAAEVMAYLRRIGTVRTGVEGRIVLR